MQGASICLKIGQSANIRLAIPRPTGWRSKLEDTARGHHQTYKFDPRLSPNLRLHSWMGVQPRFHSHAQHFQVSETNSTNSPPNVFF